MGQMLYHLKKFPPYVFQEYPKHISLGDNAVIAVDAEHEAALRKMHASKITAETKRGPGRPRKQ